MLTYESYSRSLLRRTKVKQPTLREYLTMERPAKRAKTSAEGQGAKAAAQPDWLHDLGLGSNLQEAEVKTPITFYTLPYELRSEIYYLAGIPTKTIFDLMEKPIFHGIYDWPDFSDCLCYASDSYDSDLDSYTHNHLVQTNASHSTQAHEGPSNTQETAEDGQLTMDDHPHPSLDEDDALSDFVWDPNRSKTIQGLLLASQQVRDEVLDILYGENIFRINLIKAGSHFNTAPEGEQVLKAVAEGKFGRVRHIMMALLDPPMAGSLVNFAELGPDPAAHYKLTVDKKVWDAVIPNLKSLRVLVGPSRLPLFLERDEHFPFCPYLMAIDQWDYSLEQLFRYLAKSLLPDTALLTDIRAWLPDRCLVALGDLAKSHVNCRETNTTMGIYLDLVVAGFCPEHETFCNKPAYDVTKCRWCETEAFQRSHIRNQQVKPQSDHALPSNNEAPGPNNISESSSEPDLDHDSHSPFSESEDGLELEVISEPNDGSDVESTDET